LEHPGADGCDDVAPLPPPKLIAAPPPAEFVYTWVPMAMWEITITCRDGSRLRFTEQKGDPPQKGDIFEVDVGQTIKAKIDDYREERPSGWRPPFFQVTATEI
jgi:hypothetical protein